MHARLGAELGEICPASMRIEDSVVEWKEWTGLLLFSDDGEYLVAGGLVPVVVADGRGVYVEPNVWLRHTA